MLVDEIDIIVQGGKGGKGCVSFFGKTDGGPDGGDGGRGGDVYIQAISDLYALNQFVAKNFRGAQDGKEGSSNKKSGAAGNDIAILLPIGTVITDAKDKKVELNELDKKILMVKGGLGGRGNESFKSPSNTTPKYAQKGLKGQEKKFKLKLRLIADFGLIGLPNAGKSSLLNELTNAAVKIGNYPFTTLEPNLGVCNGKIIADIPGLIEGASEGKGLGHRFLKHIEKVRLLLHCISSESENPLRDYNVIHSELEKYNPTLLEKEEIIFITKSDLVDEAKIKKITKDLNKTKKKIIPVSIHNWDSIQELSQVVN